VPCGDGVVPVSGDVGGWAPSQQGGLLGPALSNLRSWNAELLSNTCDCGSANLGMGARHKFGGALDRACR
jgi:hypothetical protein